MKENLHILYTSDLHSTFSNWPKIADYLNKSRKKYYARNEYTLTLDNGDHLDRVNPITEATMGKANVEFLNQAKYDAVTLGNNEGITLSYDDLYHLYDDAAFSVVCSNLTDLRGQAPEWLLPYQVFTTPSNVRIAVFGLTARFNPYYNLLGWDARPVDKTIQTTLQALKNKADIIILLSHLGLNEDQAIAENYRDINVIIGGHTHHLFRTGEVVNQTILTAVGKHGAYIGNVTLTYDHEKNELTDKSAHAIAVETFNEDQVTSELVAQFENIANQKMNQQIIHLSAIPEVNWYEETPLMKKWTEDLRAYTKADVAMLNSGLLVMPFPNRKITYMDVHQVCPHPINPVVVEITGDELIEVVRQAKSEQFQNIELKGFGFRGKVLGTMVFSGINIRENVNSSSNYINEIYLDDGTLLDRQKIYKVATGDLFSFGRILTPIAKAEKKRLILPDFIREILINTLKNYPNDS